MLIAQLLSFYRVHHSIPNERIPLGKYHDRIVDAVGQLPALPLLRHEGRPGYDVTGHDPCVPPEIGVVVQAVGGRGEEGESGRRRKNMICCYEFFSGP